MNKTLEESRVFIRGLAPLIPVASCYVGLAVPFTAIFTASQEAFESSIMIGAQNIFFHEDGAYTGEISCKMVKDAGADFTLIGHSERRHFFHENDSVINKKVKKSLEHGLKIITCIGETLEEKKSGKTKEVIAEQIRRALNGLKDSEVASMALAYEPVWAIGTKDPADPNLVQEVHLFCREVLSLEWGKEAAKQTTLIYGGSVNSSNASQLMEKTDINGLLVGGASLSLDLFGKIILASL